MGEHLQSPKSVNSTIRLDAPAYEPTPNSSAKSESDSLHKQTADGHKSSTLSGRQWSEHGSPVVGD